MKPKDEGTAIFETSITFNH